MNHCNCLWQRGSRGTGGQAVAAQQQLEGELHGVAGRLGGRWEPAQQQPPQRQQHSHVAGRHVNGSRALLVLFTSLGCWD